MTTTETSPALDLLRPLLTADEWQQAEHAHRAGDSPEQIVEEVVEARWQSAAELGEAIVDMAAERLESLGHQVEPLVEAGVTVGHKVWRADLAAYVAVGADYTREGDPVPSATWTAYYIDVDGTHEAMRTDGDLLVGPDPTGGLVGVIHRLLAS